MDGDDQSNNKALDEDGDSFSEDRGSKLAQNGLSTRVCVFACDTINDFCFVSPQFPCDCVVLLTTGALSQTAAETLATFGRSSLAREEEQDPAGFDDDESLQAKRSEEHTSELQSLMRISYAVFCLKKKSRQ